MLHVQGATPRTLRCCKLAIASGLTSIPIMPDFHRGPHWTTLILHHRDFGARASAILAASSPYKNITILGGGKSAADMVYASVKAKKHVNWVIRKTGEGPGIFMNPAATGRYRNRAEAGATQTATAFVPSVFRSMSSSAQALHQSASGVDTLNEKFTATDRQYKAWANYREREGALPNFHELETSAS